MWHFVDLKAMHALVLIVDRRYVWLVAPEGRTLMRVHNHSARLAQLGAPGREPVIASDLRIEGLHLYSVRYYES